MVAPPVESGEIAPCPVGYELEGSEHSALHPASIDEGIPSPPSEDSGGSELPRFPLTEVFRPQVIRGLLAVRVLSGKPIAGQARAGFSRLLERPPCV